MQIALGRNDEDSTRANVKPLRDQFDRHIGMTRKDFVELGGDDPKVINDHDRGAEINGQTTYETNVCVETTG
jgi:hypothetical protein